MPSKDFNLVEFRNYCNEGTHTIAEIAEKFGMRKQNVLSQIKRLENAGFPTTFKRVRSAVTSQMIFDKTREKFAAEAKMYSAEDLKKPEVAKKVWAKVTEEVCSELGITVEEANKRTRHYQALQKNVEKKRHPFYAKQEKKRRERKEKEEVFGELEERKKGVNIKHGSIERPARNVPYIGVEPGMEGGRD